MACCATRFINSVSGFSERRSSACLPLALTLTVLLNACTQEPVCDLDQARSLGREAALADQSKTVPQNECALAGTAWNQAWEQGWQRGFSQQCQGQRGWEMGWNDQPAFSICAQESNRWGSYLSAYRLARQLTELEQEAAALRVLADSEQVMVPGSEFTLSTGLKPKQAARLRRIELDLIDLRVLAEQESWLIPEPIEAQHDPTEANRNDTAEPSHDAQRAAEGQVKG